MVFPDWFRVFRPIELLEIFMSLLILNQTVLKSILSKILIYCILIIQKKYDEFFLRVHRDFMSLVWLMSVLFLRMTTILTHEGSKNKNYFQFLKRKKPQWFFLFLYIYMKLKKYMHDSSILTVSFSFQHLLTYNKLLDAVRGRERKKILNQLGIR